ncbi:gas vesicle protein K [Actinophytocola sp. NPDC049390]|uniref:gas vesicle protein K n=1 Tax=Actinophytocola sp. NPDC049390 TaxID=3363894 RepID=UPI00379141E7
MTERRHRIDADPETAQQSLAGLVLTVVELLRQLMERQAIRRVDADALDDEQIEKIGLTLMRLDEGMDELCAHFGLRREDLNLDLGPLGTLLPPDG